MNIYSPQDLNAPVPPESPRQLHEVFLRAPSPFRSAIETLAWEYNSTGYHVENCASVAARLLQKCEQEGLALPAQERAVDGAARLFVMTERIVGISGIMSNILTARLSLAEWHNPAMTYQIDLKTGKAAGKWAGTAKKEQDLYSLILETGKTYGRIESEAVRRGLASIIISDLIDGSVSLPGFTVLDRIGPRILLGWQPVVQPARAA